MRAPLRARYTGRDQAVRGIWFNALAGTWHREIEGQRALGRLSERAALEALGHLPPKSGRLSIVPDDITTFAIGMTVAQTQDSLKD